MKALMSHNMIRHVATAVLWSGGLARACHGPASASLPKGAQQSWRCFSVPSGGAGRGALVKPVKCVIFDKDGTLISFHDTWNGLIDRIVARCSAHVKDQVKDRGFAGSKVTALLERSEQHARKEVAATLGYDLELRRVYGEGSLLAWAAQPLIREAVEKCLAARLGLGPALAGEAIQECWSECDGKEQVVPVSQDTVQLVSRLKARDIKVAVCTSDARVPTLANLASLGILTLVDEVVCGDDVSNVPKPAPDNIINICQKLQVSPGQTLMVGDTNADLKMALASKVGLSVAVMSGVGSLEDLSPNAHVILDSVDQVESLL